MHIRTLVIICEIFSMTYTIAVCTVKNSWWWAGELSETRGVSFQEKIWEINASSWFYYKKFKHGAWSHERQICHISYSFCHCLLSVWSQVVVVLYYVLFVSIVLFYVLFVCKCVLYYCHRVSTPLQLKNITYNIKCIVQSLFSICTLQLQSQGRLEYLCF